MPDSAFDLGDSLKGEFLDTDPNRLRPKTVPFAIHTSYIRGWHGAEAFRELYQNWRDGIIGSFKLSPRKFKPTIVESKDQVFITVRDADRPGPDGNKGQVLGYIRFRKQAATLELTNFKAQLSLQDLLIGDSTKRNNRNMAGSHGEGFKMAALVMLRSGYRVRYSASSHYWNFNIRDEDSTLYCQITSPKAETLEEKKARSRAGGTRMDRGELSFYMWEDVSVTLHPKEQRITEQEFKEWLETTIDINPPSDIVETNCGTLILDKKYKNKVNLKGLYLPTTTSKSLPFEYGYNLLEGKTSRDRNSLTSPDKEAQLIARIWTEAIAQNGRNIAEKYLNMLRNSEKVRDIFNAEKHVTYQSAQWMWKVLREVRAFYYPEDSQTEYSDQITRFLRMEPVSISTVLWRILRRHNLVRTPEEQRKYLFESMPPFSVPSTNFALNVDRAIRASLAFEEHEKTKHIKVTYVTGDDVGIDILYTAAKKSLAIHSKWLVFGEAHKESSCQCSDFVEWNEGGSKAFLCDHIIRDICKKVFHDVDQKLRSADLESKGRFELANESVQMRNRVSGMLRKMPRMVSVSQTGKKGELEVSWSDNESRCVSTMFGSMVNYIVILHREDTCSARREELFYRQDSIPPEFGQNHEAGSELQAAACGCAQRRVPHAAGQAVERVRFSLLDCSLRYYPAVAREAPVSFIGFCQTSEQPRELEETATRPVSATDAGNCNGSEYSLYLSDENDPISNLETLKSPSSTPIKIPPSHGPGPANRRVSTRKSRKKANRAPDIDAGRTPHTEVSQQLDIEIDQENRIQIDQDQHRESEQESHIQAKEQAQRQDELWLDWESRYHSNAMDRFYSPRRQGRDMALTSAWRLESERLGFLFEKNKFIRVEVSEDGTEHNRLTFLLKVHEIFRAKGEGSQEDAELLVTKYSERTRQPTPLRPELVSDGVNNDAKELVLHFTDFDSMGQRQDAEIYKVGEILAVRDLVEHAFAQRSVRATALIRYVTEVPELNDCTYFCRVAIRGGHPQSATLAPLASHLTQSPVKIPAYDYDCEPLLLDLSPNCLGLADGFVQGNFKMRAALNFNHRQNMTWKARYPSAEVYDGTVEKILSDFASPRLAPPTLPGPEIPKIALLSCIWERFTLPAQNPTDPEMLRPMQQMLDDLKSLATSKALQPDFIVMLAPYVISHDYTIGYLEQAVYFLADHGYFVHLKKVHLTDYGIPQDRWTIMLLASPLCSEVEWDQNHIRPPGRPTAKDVINDLSFQNPRLGDDHTHAFVCRKQQAQDPGSAVPRNDPENDLEKRNIYNHQTGKHEYGSEPIQMDSMVKALDTRTKFKLAHPVRSDLLTVRELARLQGFPDDFIFYGPDDGYHEVTTAFPPPLALELANVIRGIIQTCQVSGARKRPLAAAAATAGSPLPARPTPRAETEAPPAKKVRVSRK